MWRERKEGRKLEDKLKYNSTGKCCVFWLCFLSFEYIRAMIRFDSSFAFTGRVKYFFPVKEKF